MRAFLRSARHRILIPLWTVITRGETIGLPTAVLSPDMLIQRSQTEAAGPLLERPGPDKTSTPRHFLIIISTASPW
jgi:hypothetical protein